MRAPPQQQHPSYNCVSHSKSREREVDKKENDTVTPRSKEKKEEKERKERKRVRHVATRERDVVMRRVGIRERDVVVRRVETRE